MTRGEFWLLVQSVEYRLPLFVLALPEGPPWNNGTIQEWLNREGHGMPFDELAKTLHALAARGWIFLHRARDAVMPLAADPAAIRAGLARPDRHDGDALYYSLTAEGGAVWERFARPRWHRYVEFDEAPIDDETSGWRPASVVMANRSELDRYMQAVRTEHDVEVGSERFDTVEAWQPIYWKPPSDAVRCRFRYREQPYHFGQHLILQYHNTRWCEWR